jgi:hypothetical protein
MSFVGWALEAAQSRRSRGPPSPIIPKTGRAADMSFCLQREVSRPLERAGLRQLFGRKGTKGMIHRFSNTTTKKPEPGKPPPATVSRSMRLMPLMKTGQHWCKFPVKDNAEAIGGYLCCGRATMRDDVYCAEHRAIATPPGRSPRIRG